MSPPSPLTLLLCGPLEGDLTARLMPGAFETPDDALAPPWRRFALGGRDVLVADLGAAEDMEQIAALAPRCNGLVLPVNGRGDPSPLARRQAAIARLMGVRHLVLAPVEGGDAEPPEALARSAEALGFPQGQVTTLTRDLPALLDTLPVDAAPPDRPFRMTVETAAEGVLRGPILGGRVRPGDAVVAAASGRGASVVSIRTPAGERGEALAGETVTLHLDRPTGAEPGAVLAAAGDRPESCDQFAAQLLWLDLEPLLPGRPYAFRLGPREVVASVTRIKHRIEAASAAPLAAGTLRGGDLGQVNLSLSEPVVFERFERNRALGAFALADRQSGRTVAAGTIDFALRRAANIHRQAVDVTKAARAAAKAQRPALLWFTGLSGAGKSTIANLVEQRLFALGHHTYLLDGDNVRHGLNRDLGFTAPDRVENIRRVAETAKLMVDAGLITLASFISPFRAERQLARDLLAAGEFIEVFVDAPLSVAESRDPKGLYAQARAGRIPNFTGIDSPYEPPVAPEMHLCTDRRSAEDLADDVVAHLRRSGFLAPGEG